MLFISIFIYSHVYITGIDVTIYLSFRGIETFSLSRQEMMPMS